MNEKNFGHLGTTFQQSLLKAIIEDKKFAVTIIDVIDSKYFDGPYFKYLMQNIKELFNEFEIVPNYETLQQKIMAENKDNVGKVHIDTLNAIKDKEDANEAPYVKSRSLNFCRQQVLKKALKESEEIMINGDFEEYHRIEGKIQEALQVGASTDDIIDICDDVEGSLEEEFRFPYATGIPGLDKLLKGGIAKGEMAIFLAPTGVGKTTWLTKMANSAYGQGANVLQIFFEDNVPDIRRKHYTVWTGISGDDLPKHKKDIVEFIKDMKSRQKNALKLSKLPAHGTTVADIKNKVRKVISEGFVPDMIVIDYIDCISGGGVDGEEWKGEGAIMRSLESMTDEFNVAIWGGTQGNRDSIGSEVVTTDQMGGSIKKAQIGHVVISAGKTLEQKEHNLATVTLLKSRIGKDGIVFNNCLFNNELLEIDTDTQNTLLGHKEQKAEEKKNRAFDVYKESRMRKKRIDQEISGVKELTPIGELVPEESNFDKEVPVIDPVKEPVKDPVETPVEMTPHERIKRASEVYKASRQLQEV